MNDVVAALAGLDERVLIDYVTKQRWFGSKQREVAHARVVDAAVVRTTEPLLLSALVEVRFQPGTHETYQLLLGVRRADAGWSDGVIGELDEWVVYEALADPELARELVGAMRAGLTQKTGEGAMSFCPMEGFAGARGVLAHARAIESEQSNSSIVLDEELILKAFRRIEPGINPELEMLRFLTAHGFANIAALAGWYQYAGGPMEVTLGVLQRFVPHGRDGWELALDELAEEPERFLRRLRRLGEVTGAMHTVLASDSHDPAFCPEEPSAESLGLLTATIDEEIERMFLTLPDHEALSPIAGRGEEVREQVRLLAHVGPIGRVIRHHGDFHLGQTLWAQDDWVILDFEGEPARSLVDRRRKRSPLRDVAGMLRSFAYAASASELLRGIEAPPGWEEQARDEFLAAYLAAVDTSLVPSNRAGVERLLSVFELEKAVYELRYELNNRPEWLSIPVAGIVRLLEQPAAV